MAAEQLEERVLVLEYRRDENFSSGAIKRPFIGGEEVCAEFERSEFRPILSSLARAIRKHEPARVFLLRTDRPGLLPYELDRETVALFKIDPVAAIHAMMYERQEENVKTERDERPLEAPPLRVGYETLADAFGEYIYVRARNGCIECPGCGMWGGVDRTLEGQALFRCQRMCGHMASDFKVVMARLWAAIEVSSLLLSPLPKFFLPRAWNEGRTWINKEELNTKYTAYLAEKERACSLKEMV